MKEDDVRFGSKADIRAATSRVRFTPESGHWRCTNQCPLCANSGHLPRHAACEIMAAGFEPTLLQGKRERGACPCIQLA
jgi:hypothetical protein